MTDPEGTPADGSRQEAARAGAYHEAAEADAGVPPREHVTATDALPVTHPHHHPDDPNDAVLVNRTTRGGGVAVVVAALVTLAAVVALALAIGGV